MKTDGHFNRDFAVATVAAAVAAPVAAAAAGAESATVARVVAVAVASQPHGQRNSGRSYPTRFYATHPRHQRLCPKLLVPIDGKTDQTLNKIVLYFVARFLFHPLCGHPKINPGFMLWSRK